MYLLARRLEMAGESTIPSCCFCSGSSGSLEVVCVRVCVCMERGFVVLGKNVLLFCDLKLGHACPVHLVD